MKKFPRPQSRANAGIKRHSGVVAWKDIPRPAPMTREEFEAADRDLAKALVDGLTSDPSVPEFLRSALMPLRGSK